MAGLNVSSGDIVLTSNTDSFTYSNPVLKRTGPDKTSKVLGSVEKNTPVYIYSYDADEEEATVKTGTAELLDGTKGAVMVFMVSNSKITAIHIVADAALTNTVLDTGNTYADATAGEIEDYIKSLDDGVYTPDKGIINSAIKISQVPR